MKNVYEVLEISVITFGEDIITESIPGNFDGEKHGFDKPPFTTNG